MFTIQTNKTTFTLQENETLLEALERTGHAVEYQCRSGYCGTCRTKILSGCVNYDELPMAFVMPDEILPCCCRVESDLQLDTPK
ncbi:class I ribonucleotide reductase maintenance protein YfaE [Kingella negevensis]|nr:class I ribonucleotide reductase maintenance protein YfaE [Kingella negevensis]MDK4684986.1 class I ribonucleotide reductase maintenance protein YfaE [Kingella negevensis]MDK4689232.1 class I ribonucleotide reductase maintenance protein YfaE [Kingella negevensis]MDK4697892.1 class I ribonucleotide reductase maintenance protein YfaE [Kingella negevensis]MDK4708594.1 class I ribonucleotide reductase maintenance protein YfaE [Kingella negevensis]MDK4710365.1 class I ribonucleotide reductase ma